MKGLIEKFESWISNLLLGLEKNFNSYVQTKWSREEDGLIPVNLWKLKFQFYAYLAKNNFMTSLFLHGSEQTLFHLGCHVMWRGGVEIQV
jgi:hypothetical protein